MIRYISTAAELPTSGSYVIYFGDQIGCSPCRRFRPHFEKADELSALRFIYVDVPMSDKELLTDFGVTSMPSVFFVSGSSGERARLNTNVGAYGLVSQIVEEENKVCNEIFADENNTYETEEV